MTVAGLQGGTAKHATGVPGESTHEDLLRRGACAVPAPGTAEAARHADLGPARATVDRAHEPRRVHEGLEQHQRMMKSGPASPAPDGVRTAPAPGTRDWEPGAGAGTGCCWPPDAAGRTCGAVSSQSTRHAPGTSAPPPKTTPVPPTRRATARHTTPSRPPSAPPQGNDASPSGHGTAPPPRATPRRASPAKAPSRLRCTAAPVQGPVPQLKRKSTPKRIRLEIQQSPSEQKSALGYTAATLHLVWVRGIR